MTRQRATVGTIVLAAHLAMGLGCAGGAPGLPGSADAGPSDAFGFGDIARVDGAGGRTDRGPALRDGRADTGRGDALRRDLLRSDTLRPDAPRPVKITVTAPKGGETWQAGSSQSIRWSSTGPVGSVGIELWKAGSRMTTIATGQGASGSYSWTVPRGQRYGTDYRVRAVQTGRPTVYGQSAANFTINNWRYRIAVAVDATRLGGTLSNYQIAVELKSGAFDYSHARTGGEDLRFSTKSTLSSPFDLSYWVERWNRGGTTTVWVKLPSIRGGTRTTVYMYYGNASASSTSSQTATFVNRFISSGTVTLSGSRTYDWFEVRGGHTIRVSPGQVLRITARRILMSGAVDGVGRGYPGGAPGVNRGGGLGGGDGSRNAGAGGGGYGARGGRGGYDSGDSPGAGGGSYGSASSTTIFMGSGGGSTGSLAGGAGGGAIAFIAHDVQVAGDLDMRGTSGSPGGQSSGGGAGGGVLIQGYNVRTSGRFLVRGGDGGNPSSSANDGGGGGSGGRIKVFYQNAITNAASVDRAGGTGGRYGTASPGQGGSVGTSYAAKATFAGATTALSAELAL